MIKNQIKLLYKISGTVKALTINNIDQIYNQHLKEINGINFTRREIDILSYILHGKSMKLIAAVFCISPKTVEAHIRHIMQKLDCQNNILLTKNNIKKNIALRIKEKLSGIYINLGIITNDNL